MSAYVFKKEINGVTATGGGNDVSAFGWRGILNIDGTNLLVTFAGKTFILTMADTFTVNGGSYSPGNLTALRDKLRDEVFNNSFIQV